LTSIESRNVCKSLINGALAHNPIELLGVEALNRLEIDVRTVFLYEGVVVRGEGPQCRWILFKRLLVLDYDCVFKMVV
jgi:hypothetical protein